MTTTKTRLYYAVYWPYGRASNDKGKPYRSAHAFDSRADRESWLARGGDSTTGANYREPVTRSDLSAQELADALERHAHGYEAL